MRSIRIGIGALVVALGAFASTGRANTTDATSQGSRRADTQTSRAQHHDMKKRSSASTPTDTKEKTASGEVKAIDAKAVTLANGEQFRLGDKTMYMSAGKKISREDVKPGERIRAAYEPRGKLAYADRIEVVSMNHHAKSGHGTSSKETAQHK